MLNGDLMILKNIEIQEYNKGNKTWVIKDGALSFQRSDDVISMYQILDSDEKKEALVDLLLIHLWNSEADNWFKIICFLSLYKLWYPDEALESLENTKSLPLSIVCPIRDILEWEIELFNSEDLKKLLKVFAWMNLGAWREDPDLLPVIKEVIELINNLRYKNLLQRFSSINTEVNNDRLRVSELLKEFWFEEKYNKTLTVLDKFIWNESDEDLIPGWAIGTLREFFKSFYIDLAKKIAQRNNLEEIPKNELSTEEIGHAVNYIWKEFGLSEDEKKLLKWYSGIVNNEWAHSLLSQKKYLRLTRNIWIEIALFMLSKLQAKK